MLLKFVVYVAVAPRLPLVVQAVVAQAAAAVPQPHIRQILPADFRNPFRHPARGVWRSVLVLLSLVDLTPPYHTVQLPLLVYGPWVRLSLSPAILDLRSLVTTASQRLPHAKTMGNLRRANCALDLHVARFPRSLMEKPFRHLAWFPDSIC